MHRELSNSVSTIRITIKFAIAEKKPKNKTTRSKLPHLTMIFESVVRSQALMNTLSGLSQTRAGEPQGAQGGRGGVPVHPHTVSRDPGQGAVSTL